jgi:peptidyl-dipeptidase Dcp
MTTRHLPVFLILVLLASGISLGAAEEATVKTNPLLTEWKTPFGVPPFPQIKEEHFMPAFLVGMEEQAAEIDAIASNPEPPTFENTLVALDQSGQLLSRVSKTFYNLNSANTNEKMQAIAKEVAPLLSRHRDDIRLNAELFQRIKAVEAKQGELKLNREQERLLEENYDSFVRGGANLEGEAKKKMRAINEELSLLTLKFGENILEETNSYELVLDRSEDLAGLPAGVIEAAAEAAKERGHEGKWVITLHKPSWIPFLQYSQRRDLRERIYTAVMMVGNNCNAQDNKEILSKIAMLRLKKANLLGFHSYADFVLDVNMAENPENVYKLLDQIWAPALKVATKDRAEMQKLIAADGHDYKLASWDWWHYAEKLRKARYDLDEEELRPYFKLENVIDGVFGVATKLWGLKFVERNDIPTYHEDVKVFEVQEADGTHIGVLYTDYFPRASKRGGAWMNAFRKESRIDGVKITPVISNVGNLSKPTADKPSLLSTDEVSTLFHEFGHALHGLLSDITYEGLSGTDVAIDFVELPSQIMENWAFQPEVLAMYARHYETGKVIPQELVEKLTKARHFNQGFKTVEYLAACYLDMDWHTLTKAKAPDVLKFEKTSMDRLGLIPEIIPRYRTTYFRHIFSSMYSAGYYSYVWAEVLDADAFQAFKKAGIFDKKTAASFRTNVLAKGKADDAMVLYKKFRGAEPSIEPLLAKRGLD